MTLTPPRSGCETDQSAAARLLAKKFERRSRRRRSKRRQVAHPLSARRGGGRRNIERSRVGILTAQSCRGRSQALSGHGALRVPGKRHARHAPASLHRKSAGSCRRPSRRQERTRTSSVSVSAPCAVPVVVTNRTGERSRAGRVLVVRPFIAACQRRGILLFASRVWLLACRRGVRTFDAPLCCRASRAESGRLCALAPHGAS
jgi:hypothetical protein